MHGSLARVLLFAFPLALTAAEPLVLQRGQAVERALAEPDAHNYSVALNEGELLRAVVDQRGIDVVVTVYGPDGGKLVEVDSPNGTAGPEPVEVIAKTTGAYRIEVRPLEGTPPGKYEARIAAILTAAEREAEIAAELGAQKATAEWFAKASIPLRTVEAGHGFEDMQPLEGLIGDARVVSLGEATHGTREFFQFKHRMLEFLVTKMGFTVFGIEATMPEGFDINDYVLTGRGDARKALGGLYFWTWNTEEVLEMIEWMRRYNADPSHAKKVKFYGFDMQSAPRAVEVALDYLRKVDPEQAATARSGLAILLNPFTEELFDSEPADRKQAVIESIAAVMKAFDERKAEYIRKTSAARYAVARQHARIVQQNVESRTGHPRVRFTVRDRSMAENVRWILDHEGPAAKIVLWAHNGHVATHDQRMMGGWLRKALGPDMVVIGFAFNKGSFQAVEMGERVGDLKQHAVPAAPAGTLDAVLAASGVTLAVVDLRNLPNEVVATKWLREPRGTRLIGSAFSEAAAANFVSPMRVADSYDALVFFDTTTPARANPGGRRKTLYLDAPANLGFEEGGEHSDPPGWILAPQNATFDFEASTTTRNPHDGKRSLTIRREKGRHYGVTYGRATQTVDASKYRGKRIRLRAWTRAAVSGTGNQAYVWLRTQGQGGSRASYATGSEKPITASEWQQVERVADVPKDARLVNFGLALVGDGQVWIDDLALDVLEP